MLSSAEWSVLSSSAIFRGCPAGEWEDILEELPQEICEYSRGNVIWNPERYGRRLGILLRGRVRVTKGNLIVSDLRPGDLFGAAALFNEEERYVSTLTAKADSEVLFFTQEAVQTLMDRRSDIRDNYIRYLSSRIRFLSGKVDALAGESGKKKLSTHLLGHMDADGRVQLGGSMTELARQLNMGRASLYRDLQKLEDLGVLVREEKTIIIRNPELLAQL